MRRRAWLFAVAACGAKVARTDHPAPSEQELIVIEGAGEGGPIDSGNFDIHSKGPILVAKDKDCGLAVASAVEAFAVEHKMNVSNRESGRYRTLLHIEDPANSARYFEVLYRYNEKEVSAHLAFNLYTAAGAKIDPGATLPADQVEALRKQLATAMYCP